MKNIIGDIIYGKKTDKPTLKVFLGFLWLTSLIYRELVTLRTFFYRIGIFPSYKSEARVISVGNITVGGTGKTPLVIYLARILKASGHRVIILLRGYHRTGKGIDIVSDGTKILTAPEKAGDEAVIYTRNLDVPVVVGRNRVLASVLAQKTFQPDVILLDDGFQHLKLQRDVDIVCIDAVNPFGSGHLLPRGILRESLTALQRANLFVVNRADRLSDKKDLPLWLHSIHPKAQIVMTHHKPIAFIHLQTGKKISLKQFHKIAERIFTISNIGNPASFLMTIEDLGIRPAGSLTFLDHHRYNHADIDKIEESACNAGADCIVATEKDMVSFPEDKPFTLPVYILLVEMEIVKGQDILEKTVFATNNNSM